MTGLNIGGGLTLPVDAVTETFAILAKRGSGKTYTAKVLVEELVDAGQQVCVIDPLGVWWGLRSSADGKSDGLPVVIFGGDHFDVQIEETAGRLIADAIVDHSLSCVVDLSLLSKSATRRFMADFLERLYRRNKAPRHVVVDEADAFAPQRAQPDGARLLGAMEDLVRRGRVKGLGVTMITQRPAVLNKDVLTQAEVLVALRMTGPRDVAAIDEWVRLHADEDQARELKASLPSLPVGTAWVWSPGWLELLRRVAVRRARTFDSSATPKAGQPRPAPKRMAPVDLEALGAQIAATVEKAKADDPRELRKAIADLSRQVAAANKRADELERRPPEPVLERIEVPVLDPEAIRVLEKVHAEHSDVATRLAEVLTDIGRQLHARPPEGAKQGSVPDAASAPVPTRPGAVRRAQRQPGTPTTQGRPAARMGDALRPAAGSPDVQLKAGARRILQTLAAHHPMRVTRPQLGTLAKFKVTGGTFQTYWSVLKRHSLVDETGGDIGITQAGLDYLGVDVPEPMTTEELLEQWRSALKAGARQMLDVLVDIYPDGCSREALADAVGMTVTGGTFQTYLSTLRRNGLIDVVDGECTASPSLFLGGPQ